MSDNLTCNTCGGTLVNMEHSTNTAKLMCSVCRTIYNIRQTIDTEGKMTTKAEQGQVETITASRSELLEKLRRLTEQENDVMAQKKSEMQDFNDQLKDLKAEKRGLLETLKKVPEAKNA